MKVKVPILPEKSVRISTLKITNVLSKWQKKTDKKKINPPKNLQSL